jgi:neutral trehalase
MGSLAVMAEALGMEAEGAMWRRRAAAIVRRMIECFWDEEAGLFRALRDEQPIPVITPFNLYPLWTGQLPDGSTQRSQLQFGDDVARASMGQHSTVDRCRDVRVDRCCLY